MTRARHGMREEIVWDGVKGEGKMQLGHTQTQTQTQIQKMVEGKGDNRDEIKMEVKEKARRCVQKGSLCVCAISNVQ